MSILSAADAGAGGTAGRGHGGPFTGDGDVASHTGTITACRTITATDACATAASGGFHMGTILDRDIIAQPGKGTGATLAAADARTAFCAAGGFHMGTVLDLDGTALPGI